LKLSRQGPNIAYKDNGQPSSVAVDDESLKRQQNHDRTESTSQDVGMSPRTRSFRRNVVSPGSSAGTTPASSEPHQGLTDTRDVFNSVKNETPMEIHHLETGASQNFPGLNAEVSATEIAQRLSGSGKLVFVAYLALLQKCWLCSVHSNVLTST
jgi:hypothetical protein